MSIKKPSLICRQLTSEMRTRIVEKCLWYFFGRLIFCVQDLYELLWVVYETWCCDLIIKNFAQSYQFRHRQQSIWKRKLLWATQSILHVVKEPSVRQALCSEMELKGEMWTGCLNFKACGRLQVAWTPFNVEVVAKFLMCIAVLLHKLAHLIGFTQKTKKKKTLTWPGKHCMMAF